jgi:hypothetical protein
MLKLSKLFHWREPVTFLRDNNHVGCVLDQHPELEQLMGRHVQNKQPKRRKNYDRV